MLPKVGTPERAALRQEIYDLYSTGGFTFRQLALRFSISSTHTVSRLYNEVIEHTMTSEIRDSELARLEAWHEMILESAELVLASDKPEKLADLARAAAAISKERRAILAVDIPATLKVQNVNGATEQPKAPNIKVMNELQDMKLYRDDREATGD